MKIQALFQSKRSALLPTKTFTAQCRLNFAAIVYLPTSTCSSSDSEYSSRRLLLYNMMLAMQAWLHTCLLYARYAWLWTRIHSLRLSRLGSWLTSKSQTPFGKSQISLSPASNRPMHAFFRMPTEVWSVITDYLDARALWALGAASPYSYSLLHSPRAVSSLNIVLRQKSPRIKLTEWPEHWLSSYPSITSFSLTLNCQSSAKIETHHLRNLGECLQHLYLHYNDNMSDSSLLYLPPFLKTLHLSGNYCISDEGIPNLPATLESLHLPTNLRLTSQCLFNLPQNLTSLSIRTKDAISRASMFALPITITDLSLKGPHPPPVPALALLPQDLMSFNWDFDSSSPLHLDAAAVLPWSLRSLTALSIADVNNVLAALPRSITRLIIRSDDGINESGVQGMPPHLTHLELVSNRDFPASAFQHLPQWLSTLSLPMNTRIKPMELIDLPSSLTSLRLSLNANFSDFHFSVLPANLDFLSCTWNERITSNMIQYLPIKMKRLDLRAHYGLPVSSSISELKDLKQAERSLYGSQFNTFTLNIDPIERAIASVEVFPRYAP